MSACSIAALPRRCAHAESADVALSDLGDQDPTRFAAKLRCMHALCVAACTPCASRHARLVIHALCPSVRSLPPSDRMCLGVSWQTDSAVVAAS